MIEILTAAFLPPVIMITASRLTHSYIGGVVTALMIAAALQPWTKGAAVTAAALLSLAVSAWITWHWFHKKQGKDFG
ncbi:DUF2198 family protein [Alteribacillus sp. HJP-4]|uniref:DUF2198 family protein n=1 Tax=Alteribacillus sp. HJP-4 TaxID=2775394 RepID=UPI0035CCE9FC